MRATHAFFTLKNCEQRKKYVLKVPNDILLHVFIVPYLPQSKFVPLLPAWFKVVSFKKNLHFLSEVLTRMTTGSIEKRPLFPKQSCMVAELASLGS